MKYKFINDCSCPLYCDDRLVNAQAVIKVAEECKKALLKNNPNLKIDTEGLLPKLPTKTRGPHDDIPNANEMPVSTIISFLQSLV